MQKSLLLEIDGIVNLMFGLVLILLPRNLLAAIGLPIDGSMFYAVVLGVVLTGIGVALFLERHGRNAGVSGLGLEGAIVINVLGALGVIWMLLFGEMQIPIGGRIALWVVAGGVLAIALLEAPHCLRNRRRSADA